MSGTHSKAHEMTRITQPRPTGLLMNLIIPLLAPIFLGVAEGDVGLARMAAAETVNDYRARNHADLVAIAQVIACGLAALGSLSLSMADDISLSMTLRLRGNAVALNRSAEQNRRTLREPLRDDPMPYYPAMTPEPEIPAELAEDDGPTPPDAFLSPEAAQMLAAESQARLLLAAEQAAAPAASTDLQSADKRHREMWAIAMAHEASELSASIPNLPPAERNAALIRAAALGTAVNELLTGVGSLPKPLNAPL